ncbi:peroxisome biogenesis protein 3-2 [Aegilops tauschii subsp. strangulata]|uniref:peroxisome biogenesis protein 3-2 n=1 Tax=Aegilops tauschii subsp. strangulata TaxID=200361 RepID=UPI001ABC4D84|nr:peroxisome biogenesis protein 3-2 [Aegilops tauschii subsp. strangulata]XP_040257458.1 peroxisome biogenesis protein 3-2 [Aegilops tauschii subsp. strangulata]
MFQLGSTHGKGFWARQRWKMLLSLGVAGAGYAAYRFYDAHQKQLVRVEQHRGGARRRRDHQESRISDTTTLPFAMHSRRSRIMEELDTSHLTERLLQGWSGLDDAEVVIFVGPVTAYAYSFNFSLLLVL